MIPPVRKGTIAEPGWSRRPFCSGFRNDPALASASRQPSGPAGDAGATRLKGGNPLRISGSSIVRTVAVALGLWGLAAGFAAAQPAPAPAPLTREDVGAWLDGYLPAALMRAQVPGAVVVVVKDGQVLFGRGYGYADLARKIPVDPDRTLFRPGSISKLFVWTAVMQQVEAGRLDLDRDVNAYLDFVIPPRAGRPITLRDLMTHTAGFEDQLKDFGARTPAEMPGLEAYLRRDMPRRIFPPGTIPAYSNYGASLAGYIVQRVSGEPFEAYVEHHIFAPLGMTHSSFRQPLPSALQADMAAGYMTATAPPLDHYEWVTPAPAGALAASGGDIARFMIAHLNNGQYGDARILKPETAVQMHTSLRPLYPPLNPMALGFFREDRNGLPIISHGGDLAAFHSDLNLYLDKGVGVFFSANAPGVDDALFRIRSDLFEDFTDRYFPAPVVVAPVLNSARGDGRRVVGAYEVTRRTESSFLAIQGLVQQLTITQSADGSLVAPAFRDRLGRPRIYHETAPFVWTDTTGRSRIRAIVENGKVTSIALGAFAAAAVYQPVPAWRQSGWILPTLVFSLLAILATLAAWPAAALARRHYGQGFRLTGREALVWRAARVGALFDLALLAGWGLYLAPLATHWERFGGGWISLVNLMEWLGLGTIVAALVALWSASYAFTAGRSWFSKVWSLVFAGALGFVAWVGLVGRIVGAPF